MREIGKLEWFFFKIIRGWKFWIVSFFFFKLIWIKWTKKIKRNSIRGVFIKKLQRENLRGWKMYSAKERVQETRRRLRLDTYVGISPGSLMSVNGTWFLNHLNDHHAHNSSPWTVGTNKNQFIRYTLCVIPIHPTFFSFPPSATQLSLFFPFPFPFFFLPSFFSSFFSPHLIIIALSICHDSIFSEIYIQFFFLKAEIHFQLSARIQHFATLQINPGYWDGYWNQNALEKHINFLAKIIISISNKYYTPFKNLKFKCYFISHIEEEKLIT